MLIGVIFILILLVIGILYGFLKEKDSFPKEKGPGRIFKASGWFYYRFLSGIWDRQSYLREKERIIYESLLLKNQVEDEIRDSKALSAGRVLALRLRGSVGGVGALAGGTKEKEVSKLERQDNGEGAKLYQIGISKEDGQELVIALELESRKYKEEEVEKLFDDYYLAMLEKLKGENPDLQTVTEGLDFSSPLS